MLSAVVRKASIAAAALVSGRGILHHGENESFQTPGTKKGFYPDTWNKRAFIQAFAFQCEEQEKPPLGEQLSSRNPFTRALPWVSFAAGP